MDLNTLYFYTTTIKNWIPIIGTFKLEPIILDSMNFLHERDCMKIYGFVIMPNHLHMILEQLRLNGKGSPIASLKKYTSHRFQQYLAKHDPEVLKSFEVNWKSRKINFWQPHPDVFELDNEETIFQKLDYIHRNPLQAHWNLVKDPVDYMYSSARFYERGEKNFPFLHDYRNWTETTQCPRGV